MRALTLLLAFTACAPGADNAAKGTVSGAKTQIKLIVDVDGEQPPVNVSGWQGTWSAPPASVPEWSGSSGETVGINAGDWTFFFGSMADPERDAGGLPVHEQDDGTYWIGPPAALTVNPDHLHQVAVVLNLRPVGAWTCVGDGRWSEASHIAYRDGFRANFPGVGEQRVSGRTLTGVSAERPMTGTFADSQHATFVEERVPGENEDGSNEAGGSGEGTGETTTTWTCCAEGACPTETGVPAPE